MKECVKKKVEEIIEELGLNCSVAKFKDKVYWSHLSCDETLSENFIKEFQNEVNWYYISEFQILSLDFIREFKDLVNWDTIYKNQKCIKDLVFNHIF